jgi:hypothetical protein
MQWLLSRSDSQIRTFVILYQLMEHPGSDTFDMKKMLADYMENGLLDNIIDMFKHDKDLYPYVGSLIADERLRVRIGTTALIEILNKEDGEHIHEAVPSVLPLLKDQNPVVRGDAANLLGIIGDAQAIPFLEELMTDEDQNVKIIVKEAIEDLRSHT